MILFILASHLLRHTQFHSDSYTSDSLTYARSELFSLTQICSDSFIPIQIHSVAPRSTQCHSDLPCLTQILALSHRCAQLHAVSLRFAQIHHCSLSLNQIHSISFKLKIASAALESTQNHSVSHIFTPDSFCLPQTHPDSLRVFQICSD